MERVTEMIAWMLVGVFAISFAGLLLFYITTLCICKRKLTVRKSKQSRFQAPNSGYEMDGNLCYQLGPNKDEELYDCIKD